MSIDSHCNERIFKAIQLLLERIKELEAQVDEIKQALQSKQQPVIYPEHNIEFDVYSIQPGDILQFHPQTDNMLVLKLISTEDNRFYEPSTRIFYNSFEEWKSTISIPGIIRRAKTPQEVHAAVQLP